MASQAGKHFEGLPGWAKGVVAITVVGAAALGAYVLYKKISKIGSKKDYKDTVKDANQELVDLSKIERQTYPDSQYSGWANSIFNLINGCDMYKNDGAIAQILVQLKNTTDYLKLVKAFGVRTIDGCWSDDYTADLPTVLKKEMQESAISVINGYFAKVRIKNRI
jgi:hypothetical protein